jgi:hypothetical protein
MPPTFAYDAAAGLFTDIGKIMGLSFGLEGQDEDGLDAALAEIITAFDDTTMTDIEGIKGTIDAYKADNLKCRKALGKNVERRLMNPAKVVNIMNLPSTSDLTAILIGLHRQMITDAKTVQKNTVTIGAVAANAANVGNGTIYFTKKLDGYSKPGAFFPANSLYAGLDSEMSAKAETLTVECTSDSQNNGRPEGGEGFKIYGNPMNPVDGTPTPYFGSGVEGKRPIDRRLLLRARKLHSRWDAGL